ncbi:MAG: MFS transporter [Planctomycetota bacterium]
MGRSIFNAYREAYGGLSREVWFLSIALLINRSGSMVLAFLTLYLTEKLSFTMIEAGAIFSVYGLGSIAGAYAGGKLIKPVGAIRIQIIGMALACPLFCIVPMFESWIGVAVSIFWLSFFSECIRPANNVAVIQFTEPELHTRAFGLQRMAVNLGLSIGPAVGGWLALYDYHWLFYVDGATSLVGALLLVYLFGSKRVVRSSDDERQKETLAGTASPISDLRFVIFLALMFCVCIVFFQFHATYPKYLKDHYSMTKPMIGMLYAVNTIIIVVIEMILLNKVKRFRLLNTIAWGAVLSCLGFAVLPMSHAVWFAVVSMSVITLGEMLLFPTATSYVAQRSSGRDVGMYMSWYAMMYSFTAVAAPLLGTAMYQWNEHSIWWLSGGLGIGVFFSFIWMAREQASFELKQSSAVAASVPD